MLSLSLPHYVTIYHFTISDMLATLKAVQAQMPTYQTRIADHKDRLDEHDSELQQHQQCIDELMTPSCKWSV